MYNIYIYVTIIYTHPNVSWNHQSVSQDHPSPPAQNPHQISKPCHKISENHLKSSGRKNVRNCPAQRTFARRCISWVSKRSRSPGRHSLRRSRRRRRRWGVKRDLWWSVYVYIYICIQEYGLDIIYYTVYGLNFYSPPARWGLLGFITVVLLLG